MFSTWMKKKNLDSKIKMTYFSGMKNIFKPKQI